jgi:hypothetical protein
MLCAYGEDQWLLDNESNEKFLKARDREKRTRDEDKAR